MGGGRVALAAVRLRRFSQNSMPLTLTLSKICAEFPLNLGIASAPTSDAVFAKMLEAFIACLWAESSNDEGGGLWGTASDKSW